MKVRVEWRGLVSESAWCTAGCSSKNARSASSSQSIILVGSVAMTSACLVGVGVGVGARARARARIRARARARARARVRVSPRASASGRPEETSSRPQSRPAPPCPPSGPLRPPPPPARPRSCPGRGCRRARSRAATARRALRWSACRERAAPAPAARSGRLATTPTTVSRAHRPVSPSPCVALPSP